MWERFTERAKHVVGAAREEANRLSSEYVRTEHILLGLCRERDGIAARALENLGLDVDALAAAALHRAGYPGQNHNYGTSSILLVCAQTKRVHVRDKKKGT